jgi:hypothetical protein
MVTYKFKLIDSKVPVIKGRNIITDSNVGGTKNTYQIYFVQKVLFGLKLHRYIGTKSFLRPYQSQWDKKNRRLRPNYWGKGPLLNLWLVLNNDYDNIKDVRAFLQPEDTTKHCVKILGREFLSQELTKNLNSNQTFYQSKFVKS